MPPPMGHRPGRTQPNLALRGAARSARHQEEEDQLGSPRGGLAHRHDPEEGGVAFLLCCSTKCENTPIQPHPVGGKASQAVSPGSPVGEYPPRKKTPNSTHARRRPGEDAPSDEHELCDRKFTCPNRRPRGNTHASPSYPVRSPRTLREPPLRHPQKTLRKPSPQGTWGQSQRRSATASDTAISRGGGRVLCDTLAAPWCQWRGVILVNSPSRVNTQLGP